MYIYIYHHPPTLSLFLSHIHLYADMGASLAIGNNTGLPYLMQMVPINI